MTNTLYCDDYKKQCPVCGAFTFESARLCYGCMHRFNDDASVHVHSLSATGTSSLECISESAPASSPAVMGAFDSSCVSTSSPAETCARSSSVAGTGAFASPSEEIGACAFSHVAASLPTATSAFTSSPIAMDTSVYTCVPATTSMDAYVQRLPCEQHNYFSSYKTY